MKILITGGSGFIGTNIIDFYLKKSIQILNIDIKPPQKQEHIQYWKEVDIRNYANLLDYFIEFEPDYVIHLAARADQRGKNLLDYNTNTIGVENVMKICSLQSSIKKVIFTSTMLVCKVGYYPKNDSDYCPPNLYGESKMIGEKIIKKNAHNLKFNWSIVRPTSIWGPWFGPTYRDFFVMIIRKKYVNFSGKSSTKVYGYIDNTIYQIDKILFNDETNGKTYYLGDYSTTNIKTWANEIANELNISLITIPKILISILAVVGDILKYCKIKFPMTSFRLKNMTTDNVIPMNETQLIAPNLPVSREIGTKKTLEWLNQYFLKDE